MKLLLEAVCVIAKWHRLGSPFLLTCKDACSAGRMAGRAEPQFESKLLHSCSEGAGNWPRDCCIMRAGTGLDVMPCNTERCHVKITSTSSWPLQQWKMDLGLFNDGNEL